MKYYIATRGSEAGIIRARKVRDSLAADGHIWTLDWTIAMEANFAAGKRDTDLTFEDKKVYATKDRAGAASVLIYLEDDKSEGSAGEFCYADAWDIPTIASCHGQIPRCLFVTRATRVVHSDEELVELVRRVVAAGRNGVLNWDA